MSDVCSHCGAVLAHESCEVSAAELDAANQRAIADLKAIGRLMDAEGLDFMGAAERWLQQHQNHGEE